MSDEVEVVRSSTAAVGIRALQQHASAVVARVAAGERIVVTDRGRPAALLVPNATPERGYAALCGGVRAGAAERPETVKFKGIMQAKPQNRRCPRQESNLRTRFRKPMLYPLSYGGMVAVGRSDVEE